MLNQMSLLINRNWRMHQQKPEWDINVLNQAHYGKCLSVAAWELRVPGETMATRVAQCVSVKFPIFHCWQMAGTELTRQLICSWHLEALGFFFCIQFPLIWLLKACAAHAKSSGVPWKVDRSVIFSRFVWLCEELCKKVPSHWDTKAVVSTSVILTFLPPFHDCYLSYWGRNLHLFLCSISHECYQTNFTVAADVTD